MNILLAKLLHTSDQDQYLLFCPHSLLETFLSFQHKHKHHTSSKHILNYFKVLLMRGYDFESLNKEKISKGQWLEEW